MRSAPERSDVSVYVLNMGQPVKIVDLAERIIRLSGLEPGRDIEIAFTGIRPGERLHEILFAREEETTEIGIPGIVAAKPVQPSLEAIRAWVATLEQGLARNERAVIYNVLRDAVPEFRGEAQPESGTVFEIVDLTAFFKAEFAEHHDVARRTEAALSGAFAGLVGGLRHIDPRRRQADVLRQWRQRRRCPASRDRIDHPLQDATAPPLPRSL